MTLMTKKAALGALALIAAAAAATSACGRVGALQTPATVEAQRKEDAARAARGDTRLPPNGSSSLPTAPSGGPTGPATPSDAATDRDAPRSTRDIQDPAQKLSPLSAAPVVGAPDPLGSPVSTRPPG